MGKPAGEVFDSTWRAVTEVKPCSIVDVDAFIEAHYLHRRPGVVVASLAVVTGDRAVGCIVFALPPKQTSRRYGGVTWELARLYLIDELPRNAESWVVAKALRWIRRCRPEVQYVVSYADPSAGHAGVIYQAANFQRDGMTDDERKTPRFDYIDAGTGKHYSRRGHVPDGVAVLRRPRVSKHRYVYNMKRATG